MTAPSTETNAQLDHLATVVRDRGTRWEAAWDQLLQALLPQLERHLQVNRRQIPGGDMGVEEGIAAVLGYWHERVCAGELLRNWRSGGTPVAGYLCSRATVHIARRAAGAYMGHALGGEAGDMAIAGVAYAGGPDVTAWDVPSQPLGVSDSAPGSASGSVKGPQSLGLATELDAEAAESSAVPGIGVCYFYPLGPAGLTQGHLVAGLQLYPRLDWQRPPADQVAQAMPAFLAAVPATDWQAKLTEAHQLAQAALAGRERALVEQISNGGKGVSPRKQRELQNKMIKNQVEQRIRPLDADQMMALTGASRNVCDQHRSRYRRQHAQLVGWDGGDAAGAESAVKPKEAGP